MRNVSNWSKIAAAIFAFLIAVGNVSAQPITPGNLVIYRAGNGAAALGTTATPVFMDEYTPAGSLVQSIIVPTSGASAITCVGNATTEGIMSLSQDQSTIIFTGYRKDAGGTNPSSDAPATTNRLIGTLNMAGIINTPVALTDPTGTIRSATSTDGASNFYFATSVAVRQVPTPGPAATSVQIDARNSRQVLLSGNTLYASNGSTAITGKVQSYGTLPTGATTATPVVNLATADAVNGFFMCDVNPAIAGNDTLYALSTVENLLRKYSFDGTTWNANGSIPASSTQNLWGTVSGTNVNLFLTSGSSLFAYSDASGVGGPLTGTFGTAIALAGTNTAFRGIVVTPVPEPASISLMCMALAGIGLKIRKRNKSIQI